MSRPSLLRTALVRGALCVVLVPLVAAGCATAPVDAPVDEGDVGITEVRVTPAMVALAPTQSRQFEAAALNQAATQVASSIGWSASGGAITQDGLYTAGDSLGLYEVIAFDTSGVADTASVTVQAPSPQDARLWGVHEIAFTGPSSASNPFVDVQGTVTFQAPSGQTLTVDMFYDGDGQGGQTGDVWKTRFMPDEAGTWSWSSSSGTPSLNGLSGSFDVSNAGIAGPVEVDPTNPYYFRHMTGEHDYLIGDWLLVITAGSGKVPLNHNAPTLSDADRKALLDFHRSNHLNLYSLYLQNNGDLGHVVNPFLASDFNRFDLSRWHEWERRFDALRDEGFILEFWLSSDQSHALSDDQFMRFTDYAYARLGARREGLWVLGLEVDEYWSDGQRSTFGNHFQSKNVYGRPLSIHFGPGTNPDRSKAWVDYVAVQYGFSNSAAQIVAKTEANRDAGKPVYASEFASLNTDDGTARRNMWAALMAGAGSIGNGPGQLAGTSNRDMRHFADYLNGAATPGQRPEWWRMIPADALVTAGNAHVLREVGVRYLCYLPSGGSVTLDLSEAGGSFQFDWYNPRTGAIVTGGSVNGGALRTFDAPDINDWLLNIQ